MATLLCKTIRTVLASIEATYDWNFKSCWSLKFKKYNWINIETYLNIKNPKSLNCPFTVIVKVSILQTPSFGWLVPPVPWIENISKSRRNVQMSNKRAYAMDTSEKENEAIKTHHCCIFEWCIAHCLYLEVLAESLCFAGRCSFP